MPGESPPSGLRSLAEVEEDIHATEEKIAALTFHGATLELAREQLAAAADEHYRDSLPRLNQQVGESRGRVTGGRYREVQIDNVDLQVRLQVPALANPVTTSALSRGTQEQIYLILRLGLTELMSGGEERLPLMPDDPFVNYDAERLMSSLEFLMEIAAHTQVLIFTKDEATAEWFQAKQTVPAMHALHGLQLAEQPAHG